MKAAFTACRRHTRTSWSDHGQLGQLLESGEARRMSKRRGDIVTIDDLVARDRRVDAARFLLVGRSQWTTTRTSTSTSRCKPEQQQPGVLTCSTRTRASAAILRNLPDGGARPAGAAVRPWTSPAHERSLLRALARFPDVLVSAAEQRAPHRVHGYLGELAAEFHVFYRHCRVLTDDPDVTAFRAGLCAAVRTTLAAGLGLLGVGAPETM